MRGRSLGDLLEQFGEIAIVLSARDRDLPGERSERLEDELCLEHAEGHGRFLH